MKTTSLFQPPALLMAMAFLFVACEKETATSNVNNKPPFANTGRDTTILHPGDTVNLDGSASYDPEGKITNFLWRQIWGANVPIINPQSAKTTVKNLIPGNYQFELKVTDNGGLSSKDTVMVNVNEPLSGSVTSPYYFNKLPWIFPWYAAVEIKNIYTYVPQGKPIKVFIQRGMNPTWIEVQPHTATSTNTTYEYFIETRLDGAGMYHYGSLYIFYLGTDTNDTPNVKVEF